MFKIWKSRFQSVPSSLKAVSNSFIFQRGVAAALIYGCSLYLAKATGEDSFGEIAFFLYLVKFMKMGHLGSVSGYIYAYYQSDRREVQSPAYLISYSTHLGLVALFVYFSSSYLGKVYALAAIGFALLIPFFSIEPILRVHKQFYISLLPDLVLYISVALSHIFLQESGLYITGETAKVIEFSFIFMLGFYPVLIILWRKYSDHLVNSSRDKIDVCSVSRDYLNCIAKGFPIYLSTLSFSLLLFVDRFFLERYYSHFSLSLYMLSFQLALGASLPITSKNFVGLVEIGEEFKEKGSIDALFRRQLRYALVIGLLTYSGLVISSWVLENRLLTSYSNLALTTSLLGLGLTIFSVSGSISPIVFFFKRQHVLLLGMFGLVSFSIINNLMALVLDLSPIYLTCVTSASLAFYGLFATYFAWNCSRDRDV